MSTAGWVSRALKHYRKLPAYNLDALKLMTTEDRWAGTLFMQAANPKEAQLGSPLLLRFGKG